MIFSGGLYAGKPKFFSRLAMTPLATCTELIALTPAPRLRRLLTPLKPLMGFYQPISQCHISDRAPTDLAVIKEKDKFHER